MKTEACDICKHFAMDPGGTTLVPYPEYWCAKDHWEGLGPETPENDPWKDCPDFQSTEG